MLLPPVSVSSLPCPGGFRLLARCCVLVAKVFSMWHAHVYCLLKKTGIQLQDVSAHVLKKLQEPPPEGQTHWHSTSLAQALNVSQSTVHRVLKKAGKQLQNSSLYTR